MDDRILVALDRDARASAVSAALAPTVTALLHQLNAAAHPLQAWQPLDADVVGLRLPEGIVSVWLFALRACGSFPSERHPNSWQRSVELQGRATFEIYRDSAWHAHPLNGAATSADGRAISIPPNVWHRIEVGAEPLVSLSFHTVPADQLIEETCVGDDFSRTERRLYADHG
jgi:hypothetical protein